MTSFKTMRKKRMMLRRPTVGGSSRSPQQQHLLGRWRKGHYEVGRWQSMAGGREGRKLIYLRTLGTLCQNECFFAPLSPFHVLSNWDAPKGLAPRGQHVGSLPPSFLSLSLSFSFLQLNCVPASEQEKPAASCYGCTGLLHRPHQILRPVLAVKLSGTMFRNRCWPTTFSHCSGRFWHHHQ